jgi:hypothetical protein
MNVKPKSIVSSGARLPLLPTAIALLALLVLLAGHGLAEQDTADERAQQLQHDHDLIETLVDGGLELAQEDDPLKRADLCNTIANALASEVKNAVKKKNSVRAALLSEQMQSILVQGMAVNLVTARQTMIPDSPQEVAIAKLGEKVAVAAKSIEDEVDRIDDPTKMQSTLIAVHEGRKQIELAIKAKGKSKDKKGPPAKKGKN